jgi:hypothetical protein
MARDRIQYNSLAVYATNSPATGAVGTTTQLKRITNLSWNFNVSRTPVQIFGRLARLSNVITEPPTVGLSTTWHDVNANNESTLEIVLDGSNSFARILSGVSDTRNYAILLADNEDDAIAATPPGYSVIGIGNAGLTSYSAKGAVGGFPECSISVEGMNFAVAIGTSIANPSIDPRDGGSAPGGGSISCGAPVTGLGVDILRQGDVTLNISNAIGVNMSDLKVQNYDISVSMNRSSLNKLGNRYAYARKINFPATITANFSCELGDLAAGNLRNLLCSDAGFDVGIVLKTPTCPTGGPAATPVKGYTVKGAQISSQDFGASIGGNATCNLSFVSTMSAPSDTSVGLFISGITE